MTALGNHWPTLSRPLEGAKLRAISFGAGVQSTTMLFMAAEGMIGPMPDVALFADTGDEPVEVYDHLKRIQARALPFPVEIVSAGSIREQMLGWSAGVHKHANGRPPLFVKHANGKVGQTRRQCTQDWKIVPLERRVRELVGIKRGSPGPATPVVEQWIGISTDEIGRLKAARRRWLHNRHPLIEANMDRRACSDFLASRGVKAPRSACRICTFRSDLEWRHLKESPDDFEAACEVDDSLRSGDFALRGAAYLHRSGVALRDVDFSKPKSDQFSWLGECEGVCGV